MTSSVSSLTSKYAVGIPTRDRDSMVIKCIEAFEKQTLKPDVIIVVNNNTGGSPLSLPKFNTNVVILENTEWARGIVEGNKIASEWIYQHGYSLGVKWDDDLLPEPDCFEKLIPWCEKYNAVGGCYPNPKSSVWEDGPRGSNPIPSDNPNQIQFFQWFNKGQKPPAPMEINCLYSSYVYSVPRLMEVGGYKLFYSPIAYREDSEMSYRLGKCLIVPAAIAIHYVASGGVRYFSDKITSTMRLNDHIGFLRRMLDMKVDLSTLFKPTEMKGTNV